MKIALMKSINDVIVKEASPLRPLEPHEIKVRVASCGVCGTDVSAAHDGLPAYQPFGHEIAGTVIETGRAVANVHFGQEVLLESASACGQCRNCKNAKPELCSDIKAFKSCGFAEEMISPAICAIPYDSVTPDEAALTEPLAVAIDMHRLADISFGDHVLISGLGPIGLMALQLARRSGAEKIYAGDLSKAQKRLALAKKFGADEVIEVDKMPLGKYRFSPPINRFLVSSPPQTIAPMLDIAAKGAIISYIGIKYGDGATLAFDANKFHFKKLQLRASFASPALSTPLALSLIQTGGVDVRSLISHRFPLTKIAEAMRVAADAAVAVKVMVHPSK